MDKPDSSPYDYQNEPGVTDATFQDFIAPLLAGLGIGKVASSIGSKALPSAASAVKGAMASAPAVPMVSKIEPMIKAAPLKTVREMGMPEAEAMLDKFMTGAQKIGDYARVLRYKALRAALEQEQLSPDEVVDSVIKLHYAD